MLFYCDKNSMKQDPLFYTSIQKNSKNITILNLLAGIIRYNLTMENPGH